MLATKSVAVRSSAMRVRVRNGHLRKPVDYAHDKVAAVVRESPEPVLFTCTRLSRHGDLAVSRPVVAQANLDLEGRKIRVSVTAPSPWEAVDLLAEKLRRRLDRLTQPHRWRGADRTSQPEWYAGRRQDERQIIRRKSFTVPKITVNEAAYQMDLMDYDFHLFTERDSGQDSVVYRACPTGYRLAQIDPQPDRLSPYTVPLTISLVHAPLLSTMEAVDRLNFTGLPFLFFLDAEHIRGSVLYRRYDGHYGLITPG